MVKSLVDTESSNEIVAGNEAAKKSDSSGSARKARSADEINGWANNEVRIGETEAYLEELLENIRGGRRVNLKGSLVTSKDRFNPTK